jgi:DNA segregation ATPase FtsK/SpoIIIE-like protein
MNTTNRDYFTFNVHNTALVTGKTGSGKTELARKYMRRIEQAYTPEQMKYVIYDFKVVEFDSKSEDGAKKEYLYTYVRFGSEKDMDYFEELADLAKNRAETGIHIPLLFIYLDECDLAAQYPERFQKAVLKINRYARDANIKFIFSTSRAAPSVIPEDMRDSFDLILAGNLASKSDEEYLGIPNATSLELHEFAVKEN